MSRNKPTRDIQKVAQKLFREIWKLAVSVTKDFFQWLFRGLLVTRTRQRRTAKASGFVLPTVVLLLLVVGLVIGAILFRTGSRTNQVITQREQQVIYNAATPAIDRARAKLEYLFTKEEQRLPLGTPPENKLLRIMLNQEEPRPAANPYNLPDETQLDLDADGTNDLAWYYQAQDRSGQPITVAYSILLKSELRASNNDIIVDLTNRNTKTKAGNLIVRNGPIKTNDSTQARCANLNLSPEQGWYPATTGTLRKTFQINAVVISNPNNSSARKITTLELQQDRQVDRGNKWGAWFRYDLELYPGVNFRWNGSMHTEGNLMIRPTGDPNDPGFPSITGYLISSPNSCLYAKDASEITVTRRDRSDRTGQPEFRGIVVSGTVRENAEGPQSTFHLFGPDRVTTGDRVLLNPGNDSNANKTPGNLALDPVALYTRDISRARGGNETNADTFDEGWNRRSFASDQRIFNQFQPTPFVDDTYRADDRLGPKPQYDRGNILVDSANRNGVNISASGLTTEQKDKLLRSAPSPGTGPETLGLDGYWERRANVEGLRVIVGERLELGNDNGWVNSDLDSNGNRTDFREIDPLYPQSQNPISHEQQQRVTLRDNVAAVQGTVIYHAANPGSAGNFPIACLATTAHAGTQNLRNQSKNFGRIVDYSYPGNDLFTDFFSGKGTNGWEYNYYTPGNLAGGPVRTALENLARFAGEVDGAFPPVNQTRVFPHPYLSMWGNFSNLRRALEASNGSIADNSYIHSAACTLGILAHNIDHFETYTYSPGDLGTLDTQLKLLMDGNRANGEVEIRTVGANRFADVYRSGTAAVVTTFDLSGYPAPGGANEVAQVPPDAYIAALPTANQPLARLVYRKEQLWRDRNLGFANSAAGTAISFDHDGDPGTTDRSITPACEITTRFPGAPANPAGLATICPLKPKYPALYYIFPTASHNRNPATQPASEPYITPEAGRPPLPPADFTVVEPGAIELQPQPRSAWRLPSATPGAVTGLAQQYVITDRDGTTNVSVPFLDSAFYDGREAMTVRALNIDLNLLKTNTVPGSTDTWLPANGIIYAFREDAKREDAISRRASGTSTDARNPADPTDPALEPNWISRKPVDFKPDPDRRPYGFRLTNGRNLTRGDTNPRGMTFVTDNSVYIQGDFNLHGANNDIEEFTAPLNQANWDNFYTRDRLEDRFAKIGPGNDPWRPTEILSDAITILSNNFNEGRIDFGIIGTNGTGAAAIGNHSFRGINRPTPGTPIWVREDNSTNNTDTSILPIKLSRNGHPILCSIAPAPAGAPCPIANQQENLSANYEPFTTNHRSIINAAAETRVNAVLISGIVPSQANQGNGGLHNFPRLIEMWNNTNLRIAGSFIQLNLSTSATGLFDQDGWEPGVGPGTGENVWYYQPPNRLWGYDVGLQYAAAGPAAQRLTTPQGIRSEFYQELPSNDPYICLLRRAVQRSNGQDTLAQQECVP